MTSGGHIALSGEMVELADGSVDRARGALQRARGHRVSGTEREHREAFYLRWVRLCLLSGRRGRAAYMPEDLEGPITPVSQEDMYELS